MIVLPAELCAAVARELVDVDSRHLAAVAARLSEHYRAPRREAANVALPTPPPRLAHPEDALVYAALALPATFARARGALAMVEPVVGEWSPRTLLDLGSGPGVAAWAVADAWPGLERVVAMEREQSLIALGRRLAAESPSHALRECEWQRVDLSTRNRLDGSYDVVVLSHVLGEMDRTTALRVASMAWSACKGVLLVVEPGTPAGFDVVRAARAQVIAENAVVLAPCPHEAPCPLVDEWCHFAQRVERPAFQRRVKGASLGWEDAKLSFAALSRFPATHRPWARMLHDPQRAKGHMRLSLCTESGLATPLVARRDGEVYRRARRLEWGSPVAHESDLMRDAAEPTDT